MSESSTPVIDNKELMNKVGIHLNLIKKKTGQDPKIILGIFAVALFFTFMGWFQTYITCIVGIVLPTYWSIKAIETKEPDDDKQWLTYWSVYAVFTFFDLFSYWIIKIFPFYFIIKLIFLVWCFMPNTQGAIIIYDKIIKKYFIKYENKLDTLVDKVLKKGKEVEEKAKEELEKNKDKIASAGLSAASAVNEAMKKDQ
jgi:receptor expression-enhancing protein 5/6